MEAVLFFLINANGDNVQEVEQEEPQGQFTGQIQTYLEELKKARCYNGIRLYMFLA